MPRGTGDFRNWQNIIDHSLKDTRLYLILCGSQISFMEKQVLGSKSPLFGQRTSRFRLEGFDYFDAAKMLPGVSNEDKIKYYEGISSGKSWNANFGKILKQCENETGGTAIKEVKKNARIIIDGGETECSIWLIL